MIVNSTEVKNSFGKMLKLLDYEDIIIKKNGLVVAKLTKYSELLDSEDLVKENAEAYETKDRKVTYEEFLKLCASSNKRYELINGEIFLLSSPKVQHQIIVNTLHGELYKAFEKHKCTTFVAPFDITLKIDEKINVLQPDLGILCDLNQSVNHEDQYTGIPKLVVEVLSPTSITRERVFKLNIYMLSGIKEYWIVDPEKNLVSVYQFQNYELINDAIYKKEEGIKSFIFDDLHIFW